MEGKRESQKKRKLHRPEEIGCLSKWNRTKGKKKFELQTEK